MKGDIMTYIEKEISYADYVRLRESVNWNNFFKEQTEKCLKNTLYSIEVIDDNTIIGMGRLIGDGIYEMIFAKFPYLCIIQKNISSVVIGTLKRCHNLYIIFVTSNNKNFLNSGYMKQIPVSK